MESIRSESASSNLLWPALHPDEMSYSARFSRCRRYRYMLERRWDDDLPTVMFIGLNPSTADERRNDPTIRRCIAFAQRWGYGGLVMTNLFAIRSTDPAALRQVDDPIGPQNDAWLDRSAERVDLVVAAWGVHGSLQERDQDVRSRFSEIYCLGTTKGGAPRHPLYLAANSRLRLL